LQGHQAAAALAEEEGTFLVMCYALLRICAKSDSLLMTLHTEGEGINLDDYYGKDKENIILLTTTTMASTTMTMAKK
jgi:hypothetical protein